MNELECQIKLTAYEVLLSNALNRLKALNIPDLFEEDSDGLEEFESVLIDMEVQANKIKSY